MSNVVQNKSQQRRNLLALALILIAAFSGDAAMLAVISLVRHTITIGLFQWLISVAIISAGSYLFFGLPQLKAWDSDHAKSLVAEDFRMRWSIRMLKSNNYVAFVLASFIGGPIAVGYAAGYSHDSNAKKKTFVSSIILAVCWTSIYLGIINLILKHL
jgi:hypothetical protein